MGDVGSRVAASVHHHGPARRRRSRASSDAPNSPTRNDHGGVDWGQRVVAPSADEALRVKSYLVVQRNAVRDYLDVADYYDDRSGEHGSVQTSLAISLAEPTPRDADVIAELPRYKRLDPRWHDWNSVIGVCRELALGIAGAR